MSYVKNNWVDGSSPDLEASNLNHIEQGIYDAHQIAESKQDELISGETIKTINGNNLLGSGNIQIGGGGGGGADIIDDLESTRTDACLSANQGRVLNEKKQEKLIAGENIEIDEETNTISATGGGGGGVTIEQVKELIRKDNEDKYYVGRIVMETENVNPATWLGFGTWIPWGSGQVPVGVKSGDTDFGTAEKTGGSKDAIVVSHSHPISGTHRHEVGSHTHSFSGSVSGTTGDNGSHTHTLTAHYEGDTVDTGSKVRIRGDGTKTSTNSVTCGSAGSHSHSFSGSVSGTTGNASSGYTDYASVGNTDSVGSSGTGKNLQPYITCYMWKRTA